MRQRICSPLPDGHGYRQTTTGPNCQPTAARLARMCARPVNPFFKETSGVDANAFGDGGQGNGQTCGCHQHSSVGALPPVPRDRFNDTTGRRAIASATLLPIPQLRCTDGFTSTADNAANVNACVASMSLAQASGLRLFLDLGIHRIAKRHSCPGQFHAPGTSTSVDGQRQTSQFGRPGFSAAMQRTGSIGVGSLRRSPCFARPLTTTNMFFGSSILWDGARMCASSRHQTPASAQARRSRSARRCWLRRSRAPLRRSCFQSHPRLTRRR